MSWMAPGASTCSWMVFGQFQLEILHEVGVIKSWRRLLVSLLVVIVQELEATAASSSVVRVDLRCSEWRAGIAHVVPMQGRVVDVKVLLVERDVVVSSYELVHFLASWQSLLAKPELVVWK